MRAYVGSIAAVVFLLASFEPAAFADTDHDKALAHLQRGVVLFKAGQYRDARVQFEQARRLAPAKPNPYRWLALTLVQLRDCTAARPNIDRFLSLAAAGDPRAAEMRRLRQLCATVGDLRITTTPAGAALSIDGARAGTSPLVARGLRGGEHLVRATAARGRSSQQRISVPAGGVASIHLTLHARRPPVWRRWWFVTAVGAAITGAVVVAVVAMSDDDPFTLPPVHCNSAGCL